MHVAVVIVGFRNTGDLVRCVGALAACEYPDFEVVVVENGGPEAYEHDCAALPMVLPGSQPATWASPAGSTTGSTAPPKPTHGGC
jgi:N-acetylglucosaminyl-diphospho-decaprenol L-rhamnosyltransferase